MKLIGRIHSSKIKNNGLKIHLEKYHRHATGIVSGSKLFIFPRIKVSEDKISYTELIISQYPPVFWHQLFRIRFWVKDRPGITEKILRIFKDLQINIETQESVMTRYDSLFSLSVIADFREYFDEYNYIFTSLDEKVAFLRQIILEKFIDEFEIKVIRDPNDFNKIELTDDDKKKCRLPTLKKVELLNINSSVKAFNKGNNKVDAEVLKELYFDKKRYFNKIEIKNGYLKIKRETLEHLKINNYKEVSYTVNSDTEEKYILVRFFENNKYIVQYDIKHLNSVGALHRLSNEIKDTNKKYNIINSYNRIEDYKTIAHWIVMIDCTIEPEKIITLMDNLKTKASKVEPIYYTKNFYRKVPKLERPKKHLRIRRFFYQTSHIVHTSITLLLLLSLIAIYMLIVTDSFSTEKIKEFLGVFITIITLFLALSKINLIKIFDSMKKTFKQTKY